MKHDEAFQAYTVTRARLLSLRTDITRDAGMLQALETKIRKLQDEEIRVRGELLKLARTIGPLLHADVSGIAGRSAAQLAALEHPDPEAHPAEPTA